MSQTIDCQTIVDTLGPRFRERATKHDQSGEFVRTNYDELKEHRVFSAMIPVELGGGGASLAEMGRLIYGLARCCGSTALALSMHSHVVAANVWKHKKGHPVAAMLEKVAKGQLVLVSTGATDWVNSNGKVEKVEGGYRVSGRKVFGSGSPNANLMVTSAAYDDDPEGPSVLHFPVPMNADGVRGLDDWDTLGMRATGSQTLVLENVFVPDAAIVLRRPKDQWHDAWNLAITVAPPLYMSAYAGIAAEAAKVALAMAKRKHPTRELVEAIGELENTRTTADLVYEDMLRLSGNFQFDLSEALSSAMLVRKTLLGNAAKRTVELAMEIGGGSAFFRNQPLERMWRDVQGSHYHPLPERRQIVFTGRERLGMGVYAAE